MEHLNMDIVGVTGVNLKEFEERFLAPMLTTRDKIWNTYSGDFPTEQDKAKYNELNDKCVFLQNFVASIRETISIAGVAGNFGEDFLKTVEQFHIGKTEELFEEQKEQIEKLVNRSQILFGYASVNYDKK